jgi:hypothetical protein
MLHLRQWAAARGRARSNFLSFHVLASYTTSPVCLSSFHPFSHACDDRCSCESRCSLHRISVKGKKKKRKGKPDTVLNKLCIATAFRSTSRLGDADVKRSLPLNECVGQRKLGRFGRPLEACRAHTATPHAGNPPAGVTLTPDCARSVPRAVGSSSQKDGPTQRVVE